ncbi:hypothetical protein HPB47_023801 [Ixodes persulcatus]|uniref:Uncharacterized protein n=1 Tax=Ixodes persulcatus TaxID=34615 RepID=A0AC60Q8A4_IXOPE|nr:hypothetical protein HPB47_023801 [Ixodes persulcatus]
MEGESTKPNALQGAPVKAGVWRVESPRTPSHAGLPTHVWLRVAFPCPGKRTSWWLSRAGPPTTSEASVGSQTPAAPPKGPRAKTVPRRPGPKPRVVLDATPSQSSEGPTPSPSQREEEAMEVSADSTEPPPPAEGGVSNTRPATRWDAALLATGYESRSQCLEC